MLYKVILKKQILHVTEEDDDFPRLMCCAIGSSLQVQHLKNFIFDIFTPFLVCIHHCRDLNITGVLVYANHSKCYVDLLVNTQVM